ncbi:hypothetical protein, partial [Xanthobacter versatilis]|uniref:hypothetical protein n=1 Tax=Xanthobacter autotrophicus (strain ATCC BAA-1158 / Py2) TaxID=78245 RepID=UPI0037274BFF
EHVIPHAPTFVTATIRDAISRITRLEERCAAYKGKVEAGAAEVERLKKAIFGRADYDITLPTGCFVEMATSTEAARLGALDRAEAAEARADALQAEVERLRAAFNAAIDYACDLNDAPEDGVIFLRMWREGEWQQIAEEFPEFDPSSTRAAFQHQEPKP